MLPEKGTLTAKVEKCRETSGRRSFLLPKLRKKRAEAEIRRGLAVLPSYKRVG